LQAHLLFLQPTKATLKKSKKPASQHTMTDSNTRQINATEKHNELLTAPKKNGGGSANRNIEQLINIGGYR